jgi:GntR family transcriptional regulator
MRILNARCTRYWRKDYSAIANLSKEEISAKAADKSIATKLEIEHGSPILFP